MAPSGQGPSRALCCDTETARRHATDSMDRGSAASSWKMPMAGSGWPRTMEASSPWTVTNSVLLNEGDYVISIAARDSSGNHSVPATYSFSVRTPSALARPLESGQKWFIDFSRDLETLSSTLCF